MATLRWMGVPEAEVRMVEGMCEKTTARVVMGGASEEFEVKIGRRQGSELSPLPVHSSTGPHQQEDGDEGCHEDTPPCGRPSCPWWQMANWSYRRHWMSGTGCLPDMG